MSAVRMMFPGGNTGQGFYSYYQYITPDDATHKYVIKGGPGVGKSSLMKALGDSFSQQGFDVELHWCSSDNNSLDGIALPRYKIAVIDGTAPHVVDPRYPGAVDEIVNLGEQWNRTVLTAARSSIINTTREIGLLFNRAYSHLAEAAQIYREGELVLSSQLKTEKLQGVARQLASLLDGDTSAIPFATPFKIRHLFASAITPNGPVSYLSTLLAADTQVYTLQGCAGNGSDIVMNYLTSHAEAAGHIIEIYHCPLFPEKIETLYLPELNLAFVNLARRVIPELSAELKNFRCQTVELNQHLSPRVNYEEVQRIGERVQGAITSAVSLIAQAKKLHDELEVHYVAAMDFPGVNAVRAKLIDDIMTFCND